MTGNGGGWSGSQRLSVEMQFFVFFAHTKINSLTEEKRIPKLNMFPHGDVNAAKEQESEWSEGPEEVTKNENMY